MLFPWGFSSQASLAWRLKHPCKLLEESVWGWGGGVMLVS